MSHDRKKEFNGLTNVMSKLLYGTNNLLQHLEQLAEWIMILETRSVNIPLAINVTWKSKRRKIIKIGASLIGKVKDKKMLVEI